MSTNQQFNGQFSDDETVHVKEARYKTNFHTV